MNNSVSYDTRDDDRYVIKHHIRTCYLSARGIYWHKFYVHESATALNLFPLFWPAFISFLFAVSFHFYLSSVLFSPRVSISGNSSTRPPIKYLNVPQSFSNFCLFCYFIALQFNTFICFVQLLFSDIPSPPPIRLITFHCYFDSYSILSMSPNPRFV
jgi:hypothetical protein